MVSLKLPSLSTSSRSSRQDDISAYTTGGRRKTNVLSSAKSFPNEYDATLSSASKQRVLACELPQQQRQALSDPAYELFEKPKHRVAHFYWNNSPGFLIFVGRKRAIFFNIQHQKFEVYPHPVPEYSSCFFSYKKENSTHDTMISHRQSVVHEYDTDTEEWIQRGTPRFFNTSNFQCTVDPRIMRLFLLNESHTGTPTLFYWDIGRTANYDTVTLNLKLHTKGYSRIMVWNDYLYVFGVGKESNEHEVHRMQLRVHKTEEEWRNLSDVDGEYKKLIEDEWLRTLPSPVQWEQVKIQSEFKPPRLFNQVSAQCGRKVFFFGGKYTSDTTIFNTNGIYTFDMESLRWEAFEPQSESRLPSFEGSSIMVWQAHPRTKKILPRHTWDDNARTNILVMPAHQYLRPWLVTISPEYRVRLMDPVRVETFSDVLVCCADKDEECEENVDSLEKSRELGVEMLQRQFRKSTVVS